MGSIEKPFRWPSEARYAVIEPAIVALYIPTRLAKQSEYMNNQTKLNRIHHRILKRNAAVFHLVGEKPPFDILYARKPKNPI